MDDDDLVGFCGWASRSCWNASFNAVRAVTDNHSYRDVAKRALVVFVIIVGTIVIVNEKEASAKKRKWQKDTYS
jgi:hypothetical protein